MVGGERAGHAIKGARVLIIGVAYKKNIDDSRESSALTIVELLEARGATVAFHDPFLPQIPPTREHAQFARRRSLLLMANALASTDVAIICTDHDAVEYRLLVEHGLIVIDTRNICARRRLVSDRIVKA